MAIDAKPVVSNQIYRVSYATQKYNLIPELTIGGDRVDNLKLVYGTYFFGSAPTVKDCKLGFNERGVSDLYVSLVEKAESSDQLADIVRQAYDRDNFQLATTAWRDIKAVLLVPTGYVFDTALDAFTKSASSYLDNPDKIGAYISRFAKDEGFVVIITQATYSDNGTPVPRTGVSVKCVIKK